jgi:FkbM family methyltransferase
VIASVIYRFSSYLSLQMRQRILSEQQSTVWQRFEHNCSVNLLRWSRRVTGDLYARGITSRQEQASTLICKLLRKGDAYIDVGASVGKTTCYASYRVGQTGKVFSFEPLPSLAKELRTLVEVMRLTNVTVVQSAVAAQGGTRTIYERAYQPASSLFESFNANLGPVVARHECTVVTLNDFVETRGLDKVDMIKIDVEGAEFEVLRGATGLVVPKSIQSPPLLIVEINARGERVSLLGYSVSEMIEWLYERGYVCAVPRGRRLLVFRNEEHVCQTDIDMVCWVPQARPDLFVTM